MRGSKFDMKTSPICLSFSIAATIVTPATQSSSSATMKQSCPTLSLRVFCIVIFVIVLCDFLTVSESREAVAPNADVFKELLNEYETNGAFPLHADGFIQPCILDVHKDLPKPNESQPLYIVPGTRNFWLPNDQGFIVVPHGGIVELHCPHKGMANVSSSVDVMPKHTFMIHAQCMGRKEFRWSHSGAKATFKDFVCQAAPRYRVDRLPQSCGTRGEAQLYRVGFNLTERFIDTMQICYDEARVRTLYAQHTLQPANVHFQKFVKRLDFSKAGGFGDLNMNALYTQKNQQTQAEKLYGSRYTRYLQERGGLFLTRGHLVAKSDLIYANQQRSTFTFYNAAPQWQAFNGGQWAAMEDQVRKFLAREGVLVHSYTGTWGTLQLHTANGVPQEFYLARDANNNGLLPVPALFYRVLVEPAQRRGIALVGVNNPHVSMPAEINTPAYVLCNDVREQVPWLQRWMKRRQGGGAAGDEVKKGYMYACRVDEFVKAVSDLPRDLLDVSELLMAA